MRLTRWSVLGLLLVAALGARPLPPAPRILQLETDTDAASAVAFALGAGCDTLLAPAGPGLGAVAAAAHAADLPLLVAPGGTAPAAVGAQLAAAAETVAGWVLPLASAGRRAAEWRALAPGSVLVGTSTARGGRVPAGVDVVCYTAEGLYLRGQSLSDWAAGVGAWRAVHAGPIWAAVACAPPSWFVEAGALAPEENVWLPEPAQLRLQTYAATGEGANGMVYTGAPHLLASDPASLARAATVGALNAELALLSPWLAVTAPPAMVRVRGARAGLRAAGGSALALAWRDRGDDACQVGGGPLRDPQLDLPHTPRPTRALRLLSGALQPVPVDPRPDGLRLPLNQIDLTAAFVFEADPAWQQATAAALTAEATPRWVRARAAAAGQLATLRAVWPRLPGRQVQASGADAFLSAAAALLREAEQSATLGYLQSATDLATEAERQLRLAASGALEGVLMSASSLAADPRAQLTVATTAYLLGSPHYRETTARPWAAAPAVWWQPTAWQPAGGAGAADDLAGEDGALRWVPRGAEASAVGLPFGSLGGVRVELEVTMPAALTVPRLVLLAPRPGEAPLGGLILRPGGAVEAWPATDGPVGVWRAGERLVLALALRRGQLTSAVDGREVGRARAVGPGAQAGALVLGKRPGDDPAELLFGRVTVREETN